MLCSFDRKQYEGLLDVHCLSNLTCELLYGTSISFVATANPGLVWQVNFTASIRPVCLPAHSEAEEAWAHEVAVASGWGKPNDEATSISPVLR